MRDLWSSATGRAVLSLATLFGVATLLLQDAVREWAYETGPWILVIGATTITMLVLTSGYYWERARRVEAELSVARQRPTPQDERLFKRLIEDLPPDHDVIARLARGDFRAKFLIWGNLTTLQGFCDEWHASRARQFLDPELEGARQRLVEAALTFLVELSEHVSPDDSGRSDAFSMSPYLFRTDHAAAYELERHLIGLSMRVVATYGDLLDVAHRKGLVSVGDRAPSQ